MGFFNNIGSLKDGEFILSPDHKTLRQVQYGKLTRVSETCVSEEGDYVYTWNNLTNSWDHITKTECFHRKVEAANHRMVENAKRMINNSFYGGYGVL